MRDDLFSCPVRKYHLSDSLIERWANEQYEEEKFNITAPFRLHITDIPANLSASYTDVTEKFLEDLKIHDNTVALITDIMLTVLEKGDSLDRCNTLPSHYTATHYISKEPEQSDIFHHPAKSLIDPFNPNLDEWLSGAGLYVNQGDVIIHPSFLEYSTPKVNKRRVTITLLFNIERIPA